MVVYYLDTQMLKASKYITNMKVYEMWQKSNKTDFLFTKVFIF